MTTENDTTVVDTWPYNQVRCPHCNEWTTHHSGPEGYRCERCFAAVEGSPQKPVNPKQAHGDKKINLALVPPASIAYEALAFMEGARKYGPFNWRHNAVEAMTYIAAAQRHIGQWQDGEEIDEDSGKPHLALAKACLGILIDSITLGNLIDNRPPPGAMTQVLERFVTENRLDDEVRTSTFGPIQSTPRRYIHPQGSPVGVTWAEPDGA